MGRRRIEDINVCLNCKKPPKACNRCYDFYPPRPLKPEEEEVLRLTREGLPAREVAERMGLPQERVSNIRVRNGITGTVQKTKIKISDEEFIKLVKSGLSNGEIAEILKTNYDMVYRKKHNLGLTKKYQK